MNRAPTHHGQIDLFTAPLVMVVSAPSGAGKSTICRRLVERNENLVFSVSTTTRPPRADETDGVDYRFVSEESFDRMLKEEAFLEWAEVHGHRYGTSREAVRQELDANHDVMLDIDVQGGRQVKELFPEAVMVFLAPPSLDELERRLRSRGTESKEEIERRLTNARREIEQMKEYDYLVINDDLERAVRDIESIRRAEKLRMTRVDDPVRES